MTTTRWMCSETLDPLVMVDCYPIGVIRMMDGDSCDDKIIAIAQNDPTWNFYHEISDLPPHIAAEIAHFFEVYKQLEGKSAATSEACPASDAKEIIASCMERYAVHFCGKRPEKLASRV